MRHSRWRSKKFLLFLFPRMTGWSILGMARQWYTLQTGKIASKTEAGEFVLDSLPVTHRPVMEEALRIRRDERVVPFLRSYRMEPSLSRTRQTLACLRFLTTAISQHHPQVKP